MKFRGAAAVAVILTIAALLVGGCDDKKPPESTSPDVVSTEPSTTPAPVKEYETVLIGTAVDIDSFLNIRAQPNTSGDVLGKAKNGDKFTIIEMNVDGGEWHRISYEGMVAYVSGKYVVVEELEREVIPTAPPDLTEPSIDLDDPENPDLQGDDD